MITHAHTSNRIITVEGFLHSDRHNEWKFSRVESVRSNKRTMGSVAELLLLIALKRMINEMIMKVIERKITHPDFKPDLLLLLGASYALNQILQRAQFRENVVDLI